MTSAAVETRLRRRGRAVVGVNAAIAVTLIVLLAAVALVAHPPAPPGVAEFAPQATKPITHAPPGQSARFGAGKGSCTVGGHCTGAAAQRATQSSQTGSSQAAGVPSALQCFTWPDGAVTQTFDPQSPPCIATWPNATAGNGGNTAPGVTATTVRVAFPQDPVSGDSAFAALQPIVAFINTHFELYGRHLQLVPFSSQEAAETDPSSTYPADPTAQRADAQAAAAHHVFAAMDFLDPNPSGFALPTYLDTLAADRVVAVAGGGAPPDTTVVQMGGHAPYEWSYLPTTDQIFANMASMVCRQLVGQSAKYASAYAGTTRKFAVLLPDTADTGGALGGVKGMLHALSACHVDNPPVVYYQNAQNDESSLAESFVKLRSDGVTSLIYFPYWPVVDPWSPQPAAASVGYSPEWVTVGWEDYLTAELLVAGNNETKNTFGVASWNKVLPLAAEPWYQSYLQGGGTASSAEQLVSGGGFYRELLMLASGIQMAGPHLTASSFGHALAQTTFPNPGAAAAPSYQAHVSFTASGDPMVDDAGEFWFDPGASGGQVVKNLATNAGNEAQAFCYAGLGTRWTSASWPRRISLFTRGCR